MIKEWEIAKLEDVLDYIQPTNYIVASTKYSDSYTIPVLTAGKSFILGYTNEKNNIFDRLPTIIFDDFTTALKFVNFKFKVKSSAMKILVPTSSLVDVKYAYYFMKTLRINADTHKRYWISIFSQLPIKIAPLPEQQVIVGKIEQLSSDLDNAIDNLKKAKDQLKVYRQSVLKYAFEGRFYSKQEELKLLNIFDFSVATPISWKTGKLSELGEFSRGKSKHRPRNDPSLFGEKYPFIQTGEISKAENRRIRSYSKAYNDTGLKQSRLWKKGTLCITIAANIAKTAILDIDACFPDSVVGFNCTSDHTTKFVMYYIDLIQQYLDNKASATAQKNINISILTQLDFPVPDFKIQLAVVSEIESHFSVCDKMEETINNSLDRTEVLRQSILKQAFEGKLTEGWRRNNHGLISGENSAKALLERIKTDREALESTKKRKK
ncbi:restriction endonuclease subunit S [bacterium]|nr:MAG: restriction endonuclease subunit S [bacterium]